MNDKPQPRNIIYNHLVNWFSENPKRYNLIHYLINWGLPYDYVTKIINSQPNDRVLEIACGPALILDYLFDIDYLGIDSNQQHLDYASKKYSDRANITFINADILTYDFSQQGNFDKILMLGFLHHLSNQELKTLLPIAANLLNKKNEQTKLITFDPVRTKDHFISNKLCDLDVGRYVRYDYEYRYILNEYFHIKQSNIITSRTKASVYIVNEAIIK